MLLSVPFSSVQSADFCNCQVDLIEQPPALFELRRKFGGEEGRVVRSLENHAANDRRGAKIWRGVKLPKNKTSLYAFDIPIEL